MIATGWPYPDSTVTEVIDLANENSICSTLDGFPIEAAEATGDFIFHLFPLICGGIRKPNPVISECHLAWGPNGLQNNKIIDLLTPRAGAASVTIGKNLQHDKLWITGGSDGSSELKSTEVIDILSNPPTVTYGVDLPIAAGGHCLVKMGPIYDASGIWFMSRRYTSFYNIEAGSWSQGPDMINERSLFGCGIMKMDNGSEIIVAAGGIRSKTTTEFLSLDSGSGLRWTPGRKE